MVTQMVEIAPFGPNVWHIQCLHTKLEDRKLERYKQRAEDFLESVWEASDRPGIPPMLVPEKVENSNITTRDQAVKSTIKIRFANSVHFKASVEYFCKRILKLYFERALLSKLGFITTHSLMGVIPMSDQFKCHWVKVFLSITLREPTQFFGDIHTCDYVSPCLEGVMLALLLIPTAVTQAVGEILPLPTKWKQFAGGLWELIETTVNATVKEPHEKQDKFDELMTKFIGKTNIFLETLGSLSVPSNGDDEIRLFKVLSETLQLSYELLTSNYDILKAWKQEVHRHTEIAIRSGAFAITGGALLGLGSAAARAPLLLTGGLAAAPAVFMGIWYSVKEYPLHKEASQKSKEAGKVSTLIKAMQESMRLFTGYLLYSSCINGDIEGLDNQEKVHLKAFLSACKLDPSKETSAENLQAYIKLVKGTLEEHLDAIRKLKNVS